MSDLVRRALEEALGALRRVEWSAQAGMRCPTCGRSKAYAMHVCSCPISLAFKLAAKAGVAVRTPTDAPAVQTGPFTLAELTLVEWARWRWIEVTAGGDRRRLFQRGKERTPDEVRTALEEYADLQVAHPELFQQGAAQP